MSSAPKSLHKVKPLLKIGKKPPKIIPLAQKTLRPSKNYPYLISLFDDTIERHVFLPKRGHICQIGKGRETLLHGIVG